MSRRSALSWIGVLAIGTAASSPSGAIAGGDEGLDIEAARAGLEALTAGMAPVGEYEPFTECPVVGRDAVVEALVTAGIDSPLATLDRVGGPAFGDGTAVGVVCSGAYVGSEEDETFPETLVTLTVADVADPDDIASVLGDEHPLLDGAEALPTATLGGATFGACREVDRHTQCVEYWQQDSFVIGVQIDDRVHVDRPTASAVLVALVPEVVDVLLAVPEHEAPATVSVPADQIASARAGLHALVEAGDPGDTGVCRLLDQATFDQAFTGSGLDVGAGELVGSIMFDAGDPALGVGCSMTNTTTDIRVVVQDFGDSATAE